VSLKPISDSLNKLIEKANASFEQGKHYVVLAYEQAIKEGFTPTNKPLFNPNTGEPVINISWGVRVIPMYSSHALEGSDGGIAK
jgi:hypothetical protein